MKLIIKEYLSSLKERGELDILLPTLLSQMGLEVFSKPLSSGNRQYGVDVAVCGHIEGGEKTVYLFSIKSGDLGRKDWNSNSKQDMLPSLQDIINVYLAVHLPEQYKGLPVSICICCGGIIKEEIRIDVSAFEKTNTKDNIKFEEWTGDKISGYIEKYLLREELLPEGSQKLLRKSIAMLEEPETSYKYFKELITQIVNNVTAKDKSKLIALRQIYLAVGILFSWSRDDNYYESAYLSSELALLYAFEILKPFLVKNSKISKVMKEIFYSIIKLHFEINAEFIEKKVLSQANKLHGLSYMVRTNNSIDINLKLFDILGRISLMGIWGYWFIEMKREDKSFISKMETIITMLHHSIIEVIQNNPTLYMPYKDSQAIDIALAYLFLSSNKNNLMFLHDYFGTLINQIEFQLYARKDKYPCNIEDYSKLLHHSENDTQEYFESVTQGSILYPLISMISAKNGFDDIYEKIQILQKKYLKHCNFQIWYPDKNSEKHYYLNDELHGATLSNVAIDADKEEYLDQVFGECKHLSIFEEISSFKYGYWTIGLLASRHYRLPVPICLFNINE